MLSNVFLRRAIWIGGMSAGTLICSKKALMSSNTDSSLGQLWGAALDGHMLSYSINDHLPPPANTHVTYLAPNNPFDGRSSECPQPFVNRVVFSLTAWNPLGQQAPLEANQQANLKLMRDLRHIHPVPAATWHSFGFHVVENWREDGFSLAYTHDGAESGGREAVLSLARKYNQAAVYEYQCVNGRLERAVLWCDPAKHASQGKQGEFMYSISQIPDSELSKVVWSGSPRQRHSD